MRVGDLGFSVFEDLGFRVLSFGFWVEGSGLRVEGVGSRVEGAGSRVEGFVPPRTQRARQAPWSRVGGVGCRVEVSVEG